MMTFHFIIMAKFYLLKQMQYILLTKLVIYLVFQKVNLLAVFLE
jgi:hypothetical protein